MHTQNQNLTDETTLYVYLGQRWLFGSFFYTCIIIYFNTYKEFVSLVEKFSKAIFQKLILSLR